MIQHWKESVDYLKLLEKWKDSRYSHLRIPTLHEVLNYTKQYPLVLEIKPDKNKPNDRKLEETVVDILGNYKFNIDSYISVRDQDTYMWFIDHTNYKVGFMQKNRSVEEMINLISEFDLDIIQVRSQQCLSEDYCTFADLDVEVFVYFADTVQDWMYFSDQPIKGLLTNFPIQMRKFYSLRDHLIEEY